MLTSTLPPTDTPPTTTDYPDMEGRVLGEEDDEHSSTNTSPPSSMAPHSDDEFTAFLLRRAAQQLGVEYTPASSVGYRAVTPQRKRGEVRDGRHPSHQPAQQLSGQAQYPEGTAALMTKFSSKAADGSTANVMSGGVVLDGSVALPQDLIAGSWTQYSSDEILKMLEVRSKALGETHPSVSQLHVALADAYLQEKETARAETQYQQAIASLEKQHGGSMAVELIPVISKLGNLYMTVGKYVQARDVFQRSVLIAEHKCGMGLSATAVTASEVARTQRGGGDSHGSIRAFLAELKSKQDSEGKPVTVPPSLGGQKDKAEGTQQPPVSNSLEQTMQKEVAQRMLDNLVTQAMKGIHSPRVHDAKPKFTAVESQTENDEEERLTPVDLPLSLFLSQEQLERMREPTLHTAKDLKSLVSYVSHPEARSNVVQSTKKLLHESIISAGGATPSKYDGASLHHSVNTSSSGTSASLLLSPRSAAAQSRAEDLQRTIDQIKRQQHLGGGGSNANNHLSSTAVASGGFSPQDATEREVARLLMNSMEVSPQK